MGGAEKLFRTCALAIAHARAKVVRAVISAGAQSHVARAGALSAKMKQIVAFALAHVTQCPYCIKGHTKAAIRHGASDEELMEAIWVAAEMRAGAAFAHSALALEEMERATSAAA